MKDKSDIHQNRMFHLIYLMKDPYVTHILYMFNESKLKSNEKIDFQLACRIKYKCHGKC